jgi:hypothetical protein
MSTSKPYVTLEGVIREILGMADAAARAKAAEIGDIESDFKSIAPVRLYRVSEVEFQ